MENLIGPEEASKASGIEIATIYTWVARRKIPLVKVGRALRFRPSAPEAWLKEREHQPAEAGGQ
jgi:excisionase family DNA binding protein